MLKYSEIKVLMRQFSANVQKANARLIASDAAKVTKPVEKAEKGSSLFDLRLTLGQAADEGEKK